MPGVRRAWSQRCDGGAHWVRAERDDEKGRSTGREGRGRECAYFSSWMLPSPGPGAIRRGGIWGSPVWWACNADHADPGAGGERAEAGTGWRRRTISRFGGSLASSVTAIAVPSSPPRSSVAAATANHHG